MTRLDSEWRRLYLPRPNGDDPVAPEPTGLIDAAGRVRAMVLSLARPADWEALSVVWRAVQTELSLPAPGIAVSGVDACQLWFSLAEPVPVADAHAFLEGLRQRHLAHLLPERVGLMPMPDAQAPQGARHAARVPAPQVQADQWSAFVAPDLVPLFADTPWLDTPPSPDGQADRLVPLRSIPAADWPAALAQVRPSPRPPAQHEVPVDPTQAHAPTQGTGPGEDPRRFLTNVMNNEGLPWALRIEAAKALLTGPSP